MSFDHGQLKDAHVAYAATIHRVAADLKVPLVDLDGDMMAALKARGQMASRGFYLQYAPYDGVVRFPDGITDDTHVNERGARLGAALVATSLAKLKLPISRHVRPAPLDNQARLGGPSCP